MPRLIEADALKNTFSNCSRFMKIGAEYRIDNAPTVDAVPIVRCGECEKYHHFTCPAANQSVFHFSETDSCSYGKRKEPEKQ